MAFKGGSKVGLTTMETRILQRLAEGWSVADIQESLADSGAKQEVADALAGLLEGKLLEPSGNGIQLSPLGEEALREHRGPTAGHTLG
ncbi:hypothetical protein AN478_07365 [Thiohalorhabdus denitrificans]|nr:hypothetical protein AN478_07365 [Thiohalorhabdus denitrificans]